VRQTCENQEEECKVVFDTDKEVSLVSVEQLMPNLIKRKFEVTSTKGDSKSITQL
jgi:hypothetical protein